MGIQRIAIVDTETTGIDATRDRAIEVGCVVWSVTHRSIETCFSSLIHADANAAEAVNGIPVALLQGPAPAAKDTWARFERVIAGAEAFVAHNASFDRGFFPELLARRLPWICTQNDLEWPRPTSSRSLLLLALALAHGVGVARAHRALDDCLTIASILERCAELGVDIDAMLARGLRPKVKVCSLAPFDQRDKVKAAGFQWDAAAKTWWREMAEEDVAALPFATSSSPLVRPGASTQVAGTTPARGPEKAGPSTPPRDYVAEAVALKEQMVEAKRDPILLAAAEQALRKFNESSPEELGLELVRFFNLVRG